MSGLRLNPGVVAQSGRRGNIDTPSQTVVGSNRGFTTPYQRLNASPQANAPMGPSFYTPTQDFWRDQTKNITEPTPGRRGIFRADRMGGRKPAMPLYRRTSAGNGDTEVSLMSADADGWTDMGGPPITNPLPIPAV